MFSSSTTWQILNETSELNLLSTRLCVQLSYQVDLAREKNRENQHSDKSLTLGSAYLTNSIIHFIIHPWGDADTASIFSRLLLFYVEETDQPMETGGHLKVQKRFINMEKFNNV